jgi:hypothetical protein
MTDEPMFHTIATAHNEAIKRGVLNIWTVYDHPLDFPHGYVARRFEVGNNTELGPQISPRPTRDVIQGELQIIRESFRHCGLTRMPRDEQDDPKIVECWL